MTISFLLLSVVAKVVIQPHALHCTSGSSLVRRSIRGGRAPAFTIVDLFSAGRDRDRKTKIQREIDRYKERDREWQRQRYKEIERERDRERQRQRYKETDRDRHVCLYIMT